MGEDAGCDLSEHVIHLQEWFRSPAKERWAGGNEEAPAVLLVNGQGRVDMEDISQPWPVFKIAPHCPQQRFRLVSALTSHCPVIISVEGHQMTVVGAEGSWTDCSGFATLAFIQYEDAPVDQAAVPDYAGGLSVPGLHLNPYPSLPLPDQQTEVAVADLRSKEALEHPELADSTFYFLLADEEEGASINLVQMSLEEIAKNPAPLLAEQPDLDADSFCQGSYTEEGTICDPSKEPNGCACFHVLHAPL